MAVKITNPIKKNTYLIGISVVFFASVVLFLLEWRNHGAELPDFEVYYRSAIRLLNGETLYRVQSDGHYIFKYSPACAAMFIPFTLFPYPVAKILYWLLLTGVTAYSFFLCFQFASPGLYRNSGSKFNLYILLLTLSLGLFLYREFAMGQVNMVLFLSYLLMLRAFQLNRPLLIALIWAAGIMIKPWGLIFLPYFLLKKKFRIVLYFIAFTFLIAVFPVFFYGYPGVVEQTLGWFHELTVELGNKQDLSAEGNHTIFSLLYRYTPLRFVEITGYWKPIYELGTLCMLALLTLLFIRKGAAIDRKEVASVALIIGLMPLIAQPSYYAFLLEGLALAIVMVHFRLLPVLYKIIFITGIILLGGNYNDLWGTELSDNFVGFSFVAIGAVFVLINLFWIRFKKIA